MPRSALSSFGDVEQAFRDVESSASGYRTLPYSAAITPLSSGTQAIVVTDTSAFTIANPPLVSGGRVVFDIKNSSGGTMGALTWGSGGVMLLAGAFTNPASTKRRTISFYCDGTNWVETGRSAADI